MSESTYHYRVPTRAAAQERVKTPIACELAGEARREPDRADPRRAPRMRPETGQIRPGSGGGSDRIPIGSKIMFLNKIEVFARKTNVDNFCTGHVQSYLHSR